MYIKCIETPVVTKDGFHSHTANHSLTGKPIIFLQKNGNPLLASGREQVGGDLTHSST